MPRFAANLNFLYTEFPFLDRFEVAAQDGFEAVELLFPYDHAASDIAAGLQHQGLELALINMPVPDWEAGGRGLAAMPGGEDRFRQGFAQALCLANSLGAQHLHIMSGLAQGEEAKQTYIRNLFWAAEQAPRQSLTIEPINPLDMPGYFLGDFDLAAEVLDALGAPNLNLQFDVYHARMITGDAAKAWLKHGPRARHIQVAGTPGRHERVRGEIDYPQFFAALDAGRYDGWVSCEYTPRGCTRDGLGWMREAREGS